MGLVSASCTKCGASIKVDLKEEAGICPYCGTAFIVEKAVNKYKTENSFVTNQIINKTIIGKEKDEAEDYLARADTFMSLYKVDKAYEAYQKAADISPSNYKGWLGMFRCESQDYSVINLGDIYDDHLFSAFEVMNSKQKKSVLAELDSYIGLLKEYFDVSCHLCEPSVYGKSKESSELDKKHSLLVEELHNLEEKYNLSEKELNNLGLFKVSEKKTLKDELYHLRNKIHTKNKEINELKNNMEQDFYLVLGSDFLSQKSKNIRDLIYKLKENVYCLDNFRRDAESYSESFNKEIILDDNVISCRKKSLETEREEQERLLEIIERNFRERQKYESVRDKLRTLGIIDYQAQDDNDYDVILTNPGSNENEIIKSIRELTSLSLTQTKELINTVPKIIAEAVSKVVAGEIAEKLKKAGAYVEIKEY